MKILKSSDLVNNLEKFIILWNDGEKILAKIKDVKEKESELVFEIVNGKEKGKKFISNYDIDCEEIAVYGEGEETVALLSM